MQGQGTEAWVTLTKVGDSWMPAPASTMEERSSVMKSVDTTASSVYLQPIQHQRTGMMGSQGHRDVTLIKIEDIRIQLLPEQQATAFNTMSCSRQLLSLMPLHEAP